MDVNVALMKGDFKLLRSLVETMANVNLRDKEYLTALINCCLHDAQDWALGSAKLLLTYGAKVGYCDKFGRNALMYAIMYRREELVKLFLTAVDFDLTHSDKWNHTALWYASFFGNRAIETMVRQILYKYQLLSEMNNKPHSFDDKIHHEPKENTSLNVTTKRPHQLHKMCDTKNATGTATNGFVDKKQNKSSIIFPYKTLPANLWEKPKKCHKGVKQHSNPSINIGKDNLPSLKQFSKSSATTGFQQDSPDLQTETTDSPARRDYMLTNWKHNFQNLISMYEIQHTSYYCKKAELLPPNQRRYPKLAKSMLVGFADSQFMNKRKRPGRRLSFDTLDVLFNKDTKGKFRRRSSVAVIPLKRQ